MQPCHPDSKLRTRNWPSCPDGNHDGDDDDGDDDGDDDNNDDNNDDDKFPPVYCVGIALQHCIKLLLSN